MRFRQRMCPCPPPRVLIIQHGRFPDTAGVLRGILHYQRTNRPWAAFIDDVTRADKDLRWLTDERWNGVINGVKSPEVTETCLRLGVPVVEIWDSPPLLGAPKVRPDNVAIGHLAAEHVLEKKFRHFGFSGFSDVSWSTERLDGFREALGLVGESAAVHLVQHPGEPAPAWDTAQVATLAAWLSELPKGVAIMACDDERARQITRAALRAGLRIPEDVAVIGVNNDLVRCAAEDPALSSIATDDFGTGWRVAEQLDVLMSGGRVRTLDLRIEPAGVVMRTSTDTLAMRDPKVAAAVNYIQQHACRGVTVDEVVAQVHASRSQLENRFRRFLGRSPQVEIRRVQLAQIRTLLAQSDLSLKEIADRTGFMHVEYMCVLFKRVVGDTPGQYRRKARAKGDVAHGLLEGSASETEAGVAAG